MQSLLQSAILGLHLSQTTPASSGHLRWIDFSFLVHECFCPLQLFEQGFLTSKDLGNEIINILKSQRDEIVFKMKLTSKDETDILNKRVEKLEKKVELLEKLKKKKKIKRVKRS